MLILLYCIIEKDTVPFGININFFMWGCSFLVEICKLSTFLYQKTNLIGVLTAKFYFEKRAFLVVHS